LLYTILPAHSACYARKNYGARVTWKNILAGSRTRIRAFAGRKIHSVVRLIYESGPASSSSYLFVCGLVVTPRAAGPRATYNDIFVSEMSRGHFLLIFAQDGTRIGDADG
jgi:hypothetical protein